MTMAQADRAAVAMHGEQILANVGQCFCAFRAQATRCPLCLPYVTYQGSQEKKTIGEI